MLTDVNNLKQVSLMYSILLALEGFFTRLLNFATGTGIRVQMKPEYRMTPLVSFCFNLYVIAILFEIDFFK